MTDAIAANYDMNHVALSSVSSPRLMTRTGGNPTSAVQTAPHNLIGG